MPDSPTFILHLIELLGVGMLAGVIGGMLGIGGGVIMIPAMQLFFGNKFGPDTFHLYKLASIAASVLVSIPAGVRHARRGTVVFGILPAVLPAALVGIAAGVWLSDLPLMRGDGTVWLRRLFGAYLMSVVLIDVIQQRVAARAADGGLALSCPTRRRRFTYALGIGLPTGLIAGVLGIGGGTYSIPAQNLLFGMRLRYAIATSQFMILFVAAGTTILQAISVHQMALGATASSGRFEFGVTTGLLLALGLAPGALAGSWLGAGLTYRIPIKGLRFAFHLMLLASAVWLLR